MAEQNTTNDKERKMEYVAVSIDWQVPPDTPLYYANNVLVQNGEYEAFLLFFDTMPPIVMGTPEEMREKLESLTSIPAKCVARVAVAKELVPKIIQALQANIAHASEAGKAAGRREAAGLSAKKPSTSKRSS